MKSFKLKINGKTEVFDKERLSNMSRSELKIIKTDIQSNLEEIALKRQRYQMENNEELNSDEYWRRMNAYKGATFALRQALNDVNKIHSTAKESQLKQNEHWLFNFYSIAKKELSLEDFEEMVKETNNYVGYNLSDEVVGVAE